jgi:hypothetical protein|tara:strand:+ start:1122 stop:1529 length:408 start_codon:yes stop_codon:yes gene_type:complete
MLQLLGAIGPIAKLIAKTVDKAVPDKDLKEKLKHEINTQLLTSGTDEMKAASKIILAEAQSGSWLTNSWRPALMWICIIVIFNNFIVMPFANAIFGTSLILEIPDPMWNLLTIGIGGYIAGRSGEKIAQKWKEKD